MRREHFLSGPLLFMAILFLISLLLWLFRGETAESGLELLIFIRCLSFCLVFGTIYLIHLNLLLPFLFLRKKYVGYVLSLACLCILITWLRPYDRLIAAPRGHAHVTSPSSVKPFPGPKPPRPRIDIISIFLFSLSVLSGSALNIHRRFTEAKNRALRAETEKAQAELSFLKAQVNPHFLFNILNNIYTLAVIQDPNTAASIMKLSNLMRYLTDEAGENEVLLEQEIACISDYISLQQLRLTQKTKVLYEIEGTLALHRIAPLILMAFVENVFKYGISNHKEHQLIIRIRVENKLLLLYCENPINHDKKNEKRTGIGLENTRKRLQHIYPDRHLLSVENDREVFKVNLTIHLPSWKN